MNQATNAINMGYNVKHIRIDSNWILFEGSLERFTYITAKLGRESREWCQGAANAEIETLIEENRSRSDVIIFRDG